MGRGGVSPPSLLLPRPSPEYPEPKKPQIVWGLERSALRGRGAGPSLLASSLQSPQGNNPVVFGKWTSRGENLRPLGRCPV